jgi:hypothetical protein
MLRLWLADQCGDAVGMVSCSSITCNMAVISNDMFIGMVVARKVLSSSGLEHALGQLPTPPPAALIHMLFMRAVPAVYPNLSARQLTVPVSLVNGNLGLSLKAQEMADLLTRMQLQANVSATAIRVLIQTPQWHQQPPLNCAYS